MEKPDDKKVDQSIVDRVYESMKEEQLQRLASARQSALKEGEEKRDKVDPQS